MISESISHQFLNAVEKIGRSSIKFVESVGYYFALLAESIAWIIAGPFYKQPVRIPSIFSQMMIIGIAACPIVFILSFSIRIVASAILSAIYYIGFAGLFQVKFVIGYVSPLRGIKFNFSTLEI